MRTKLVTVALYLMSFSAFCEGQSANYFSKYQGLCDSLESVYGIPSSVMMGIAFHESGGGISRNAKLLNNHFGIVGSNNLLKTHGIKSKYKWFPTDTAGYVGFCNLVAKRKYYPKLKGNLDYTKWVYAIHAAGYCPSPKWPGTVIGIIKKYKVQ